MRLRKWKPPHWLTWTVSKIPVLKDLRFNFIFFHYCYIIGVAIVGSIYLYPGGIISYTDALFLAAGSATQSGLNTIDLNKLHTYQQVGLWLGSMIANPIVIHSFVVFIRLYWFEKRFQHVVRDAKMLRRTRTKSRAPTTTDEEEDDQAVNRAEMGVRGRRIEVLRNAAGQALGRFLEPSKQNLDETPDDSTASATEEPAEPTPTERNEIANSAGPLDGISADSGLRPDPSSLGHEPHIAFVENQRRPTRALRIPSPREYDRGGMPQSVDDAEPGELSRRLTAQSDQTPEASDQNALKLQPSAGQHITIDEPNIVRARRGSTFPHVNTRTSTAGAGKDVDPLQRLRSRRSTIGSILPFRTQGPEEEAPYLSWEPTIGRNSAFVDLTEEQKNELGGIEYRALKTLAVILIAYYLFFHLLGIVCLVPWILHSRWGKFPMEAGVSRAWWAVFISGSSFNDQGFTLTPDSLISFYDAIGPLLLLTFLIIIGNTGFPCMLRFIIWLASKFAPRGGALWEELHFLLDHPRRCFTLLFPSSATWWLFWVLVLLNGTDLVLFIILDLNDPDVTRIPGGIRFVDGLFQAAATRTAGSSVVNVSTLHAAVQVSYMIMMYISIYPIAISLRRTNVYEERSLGIYYQPEDEDETEDPKEPSYVGSHIRRQLGFDIWYVFLGLFIISIVEGGRIENVKDFGFSLFAILFEVVSAYGTVGMSLGYPNTDASFSAQFKILSKLVIIAMMVRGRHRGLPYSLDRAVLLPSESLHEREFADATKRMKRRGSFMSAATATSGQVPSNALFRPEAGFASGRDNEATNTANGNPRPQASSPGNRLPTHIE